MALQVLLAALVGYLIGSFPTGIVLGRLYGVDPRTVGSGRTGGTNVYRAAGPVAGVLTAIIDLIKGAIAILLVRALIVDAPLADALAGLGAVAGHNWSLYLRFKGGAGTMTNAGTVALLYWPAVLVMGALSLLTLRLTKISSVASIFFAVSVSVAFALAAASGWTPANYLVYGVGQAILILWSLRPNIQRLLAGRERRIGQGPTA
jgi:acyl phosphate:glycerol-3-phosphate acyltransferase